MGKQIKTHLYVLLRSPAAILLLIVTVVCSLLLFNDMGDVMRDVEDIQRYIRRVKPMGIDGLAAMQYLYELPGVEDLGEILAVLRRYQVAGAPSQAAEGMLLLLFILPGVNFSSGLSRSLGIQRELQCCGRWRTLLARILESWVFCLLFSAGLYLFFLLRCADPAGAAPEQILRNFVVLELCVLAGLCYSYFVFTLLRRVWLAVPVMLLAEILLHRVVPGLRFFYPLFMIPIYNASAHHDPVSLVGEVCPAGTFLGYLGVCLMYIVLCPLLSILVFRRREVR